MIPWIITNHNNKKIEVVSEYDEKCNITRIDVREIDSPQPDVKQFSPSLGEGEGTEESSDNLEREGSDKTSQYPSVDAKSTISAPQHRCKCGHTPMLHDQFENQCQGEDWENSVGKYFNCHCKKFQEDTKSAPRKPTDDFKDSIKKAGLMGKKFDFVQDTKSVPNDLVKTMGNCPSCKGIVYTFYSESRDEFFCKRCNRWTENGKFKFPEDRESVIKYGCGHKSKPVILDCNELSYASWEIWREDRGFDGDKTQCWECWCKNQDGGKE